MVEGTVEAITPVTRISIDEFLDKEDDPNTYYMLTGTITAIDNPTYGNLYLDDADYKFDYESLRLINEIRMRIKALRNKGVNTLFLNDIIDNGTSPLQYINKKKVERA